MPISCHLWRLVYHMNLPINRGNADKDGKLSQIINQIRWNLDRHHFYPNNQQIQHDSTTRNGHDKNAYEAQ